jgi:hypothetical protein
VRDALGLVRLLWLVERDGSDVEQLARTAAARAGTAGSVGLVLVVARQASEPSGIRSASACVQAPAPGRPIAATSRAPSPWLAHVR